MHVKSKCLLALHVAQVLHVCRKPAPKGMALDYCILKFPSSWWAMSDSPTAQEAAAAVVQAHSHCKVECRMLQAVRRSGVRDPVLLLDEVDKMGHDSLRGDPASALLEVLDPNQNQAFVDTYLSVTFDLSQV